MEEREPQDGAPEQPSDEQPPAEQSAGDAEGTAAPGAQPEQGDTDETDAVERPAAEEPAPAAAEQPAADEPVGAVEEPGAAAGEQPAAEEPVAPAEVTAAPDEPPPPPAPDEAAAPTGDDQRRQRPPRRDDAKRSEDAVVPGAHLEPDLVLEESRQAGAEGEFDPYADTTATADDEPPVAEGEQPAAVEETAAPAAARTPLDLAADARYPATGKRKRAVARVILKPGQGSYKINGRELDVYFPRATLQKIARQPLETAGYETRMDVVAKIHGGGVSSQAIALRHGVARALVEADPNLRGELKRNGFLTRDARVKERKKAGLKKARKRPQFSKR